MVLCGVLWMATQKRKERSISPGLVLLVQTSNYLLSAQLPLSVDLRRRLREVLGLGLAFHLACSELVMVEI